MVSRDMVGIVPSAWAGQPIRTRPDSVFRIPSASVRNDPVRVIRKGRSVKPLSRSTAEVTGSIPRPDTAMSSGCVVVDSAPSSSINRCVVAVTPPAEYRPAMRCWFSTNELKSVSMRL